MTVGSVAQGWWERLQPGQNRRGGDPGALARLRRADLASAMMEEATVSLFRAIAPCCPKIPKALLFERVAVIAAVLANVRQDDERPIAAACSASRPGSDRPRVSTLRMQQIYAAESTDECLLAFSRLADLLDGKMNIADAAETLLDWPDEWRRDRRHIEWSHAYHGAYVADTNEEDGED
jgi:CRISPR type I-E-associated protein CasB/Cse2